MARAGATCLLVETMWSDPDFFLKRTQAEDIQNSVEETVNLALPYILSAQAQKHVTHNEALRRLDAVVEDHGLEALVA